MKTIIWHIILIYNFLVSGLRVVKHKVFGCGRFWLTSYNKNNKPFRRICTMCISREDRLNGSWVKFKLKNK